MGQTVVVGVDGSDCSLEALRWALDEARARDARLMVVHAWHVPITTMPLGFPVMPASRERVEEDARRLLQAVIDSVGRPKDVELVPELIEAHPVDALLTVATEADLLVVGSRGLGALKRALLGSVSQRCAHHAPCPIVIVPPRADAA